ncbi:hypothetical protein ACWC5I_14955 [Kitasatospora sp. NPDC001574]
MTSRCCEQIGWQRGSGGSGTVSNGSGLDQPGDRPREEREAD